MNADELLADDLLADDLLNDLRGAGIRLWREGEQLRFRAPRGAMDERRLAQVRRRKAELLDLVPHTAPQEADGQEPVWHSSPADGELPFPLTDIQSAYLFGRNAGFDYGGVSCHVYLEFHYPPGLDADRLQQAWDGLVHRHAGLRTVILDNGSQRVLSHLADTRIAVTDLHTADQDTVDAAVAAVRDELSHAVHPTGERPLYELRLTLAPGHSVLHVSVDFMALDWLSMQQVLTELDERYAHPDCPLPELDATFRDYVLAERRLRDTPAHTRDRAYWWDRLDTLPGAPALPLREGLDPAAVPPRFHRLTATLDAPTWRALKRQAAEQNITAATAVLAAYAETIGRWSDTEQFCIGLPVLNRMPLHPQVDRLLGDFTSLSLLAVQGDGRTGFAQRARTLGERMFDDLDHRLCSGVEVLRELARRRGREAAVLPVVFTGSIGVTRQKASAAGRDPRPAYGISQTPQVWIDCQAGDASGALELNWDVREGVFPDGLVEEMFDAFTVLLHRLAADQEAWLHAEPQPLPAGQRAVRAAVNDTAAPEPGHLLHHPLVARARAHPDRTAVVDAAGTLTYGQWLGRAAGVAEQLRAAGTQPGDFVGVLIDKSREQLVAVLGVLLAGGVYVPVDTTQPQVRQDAILTGSGASYAVVAGRATAPSGVRTVDVREVREVPVDSVSDTPAVAPDDLAYVMHTSGSTGVPKGVMISHRAAANTVHDINERFGVRETDRVLGLAALSFDLSVYDLFGPTAVGARLVLVDPAQRGNPAHWAALVAEHGVTLWNSVPAQLQMLLHYLDAEPAPLPSLRLALLSGDWIPLSLPAHAAGHLPGTELISLGGATEAAIWSIYHPITEVAPHWRSIPYGVPLANQRFHVLDAALRERPDLVLGELYIAGTGLAEGYLRDARQTAERFLVHPATQERLYRTGDLGRRLPDGSIEFVGRADQQVKIRGHRIELGEVEAVLGEHPAVGTCVVLAAGSDAFERALIAFVVPADPTAAPPDPAALTGWVAERLPAHMVPAQIGCVPMLPLTANGKVDRKRLLGSAAVRSAPGRGPASPPRPGVEQAIAGLWAEVLGGELPDRDLGFFDAGGNSLLAARLVGRICEDLPQAAQATFDVLLRVLLRTPTVAQLAAWLESDAAAPSPQPETPAEAHDDTLVRLAGSGPARLLVHDTDPAERQEAVDALAAEAALWEIRLTDDQFGQEAHGPDAVERLAAARARAVLDAGLTEVEIVGWRGGGPLAVELARHLDEAQVTVRRLTLVLGHRRPGPGPLAETLRTYDPQPYAGDMTLLRPAGTDQGDAADNGQGEAAAFWSEVCLGEIGVVDLPGGGTPRPPLAAQVAQALAEQALPAQALPAQALAAPVEPAR
ncbi:amino acid adenylation domain-containing protein [Streptomyces sp. NPDC087440]|uniref:non-ribosomal peptide synthetase n=1 Tax=Streptomyces sp. NPDC087440 TaxID=3365790 RepID=UPI0038263AA1